MADGIARERIGSTARPQKCLAMPDAIQDKTASKANACRE